MATKITQQRGDFSLLGQDHIGPRVDYSGLLKQTSEALQRGIKQPGLAELMDQLQDHLAELGTRWYSGDTDVVDEVLQLYCIEQETRKQIKSRISEEVKGD